MPGLIAAFDTTDAALADSQAVRAARYRGLFGQGMDCFLAYGAGGIRAAGALSMGCHRARQDHAGAIAGLAG